MIRLFHKKYFGFTAIEVTMVAAVIMILSLLILPLYRKRTEEAKVVAAHDDMLGLSKAITLAEADTGIYFRLQDLDNTVMYALDQNKIQDLTNTNPAIDIPIAMWNRDLTLAERDRMASQDEFNTNKFKGPYIALQSLKCKTVRELNYPNSPFLQMLSINGGPIFIVDSSDPDSFIHLGTCPFDQGDLDDDLIPVDPWGAPYIFFGPTGKGEGAYNGPTTEEGYTNSVIYSLGPDGLPGSKTSPSASDYFFGSGVIGTPDDIVFVF